MAIVHESMIRAAYKKSIKNFLKSHAPEDLKRIVRTIHPAILVVNKPQAKWLGCAFLCNQFDNVAYRYQLRKISKSVTLFHRRYYAVIEINKASRKYFTQKFLDLLIAHELSHIVQIIVDKEVDPYGSFSNDRDHCYFWKMICKYMGGNGKEFF